MSDLEMMKTTNQTMYDAAFEKDACGMGFIAQKMVIIPESSSKMP